MEIKQRAVKDGVLPAPTTAEMTALFRQIEVLEEKLKETGKHITTAMLLGDDVLADQCLLLRRSLRRSYERKIDRYERLAEEARDA